jgi:tetratricopeptide (TPR) repeat protein
LQLDATLKDAVFNQAICLERLGLLDPALRSWEKYLELDSDSGWREEAQARIEALRKQKQKVTFDKERIFRDFLAACDSGVEDDIWQAFLMGSQMRGNLITDWLLDDYLALLSQGNRTDARKKLDLLITAGRIEAEKSGDFYTRDLAAFYRNIRPQHVALLSDARRIYKNAIEKSRTSREEGLALCQQAKERFVHARNTVEMALADSTIGAIYARTSEREIAMQITERIENYSGKNNYLWLQARSLYLMGGLQIDRISSAHAINYCNRSFHLAERRQDQSLKARILWQLMDAYWSLGLYDQAMNCARQTLEISYIHPIEQEILWSIYGLSADAFNAVSRLSTSLIFEKEALQLAITMDRPLQVSRSHGFLSDIYVKLNQSSKAIEHARRDFDLGMKHSDNRISQDIKSHALLRLGHLFRKNGQLNESLDAYNECVRIFEAERKSYELLDAYRGRLHLYLQRGNYPSAQTELDKAIALFEQNRNQINDDDLKTSFFETGHDIYDLGIEITANSNNRYKQAFYYGCVPPD